MKKFLSSKVTVFGVLPLLILVATTAESCKTCKPGKPGPIVFYPIQVSLAPSLQGKSVTVDLVGVNQANRPRWESYSMSKYWKDGDAMRAHATKKTFNFTTGSALTSTLAASDSIWAQWKGQAANCVFVLVDLPGAHTDQPGSNDARRQILSLDMCDWPKGTTELKVVVSESGPQVTPILGK